MKKRILILTIGLMFGLAVTGCNKNKESAENSLESSLESTEAETETEDETEVQRPTPSPAPGEDGCGTIKPPEMMEEEAKKETIFNMQPTGGEDCVPKPPYMVTEEEFEFGEPVNQETGAEETESQESEYVIKAEGDEWIDYSEDFEFPEVPYKKKLDGILGDDLETGYGFDWNWESQDDEYYHKWIDCGMYYKVKDVDIVSFYDSESGGMDFDIIAHFDELYIMKEGAYRFNRIIYMDVDDWFKNYCYGAPRLGLTFNEKGYVIGWFDASVS